MLKRLELKNCFKHANCVFEFTTGLTAITGPNEAGKSLIFEMIAFALFGSVALRGSADDYKKLYVALDFTVLGVEYRVVRSGSKCLLYVNGKEVATGIKVVNPKLLEILGYDFKVFSIANCANQDELLKLGNMKPTERKSMVDNVIGLTIIDKLSASIATKIGTLNTELETLRVTTVQPQAPVVPEGYRAAGEIQTEINGLVTQEQRFHYLRQWLSVPHQQPIPPTDPQLASMDELVAGNAQVSGQMAKLRELEKQVARYTEPTLTPEQIAALKVQWEQVDKLSDLRHQLSRLTAPPPYTRQQLEEWSAQAQQAAAWKQKEQLLAQGENECPKCKHHWPVASEQLKAFEKVSMTPMPQYVPGPHDYSLMEAYERDQPNRTTLEAQIAELGEISTPTISKDEIAIQERSLGERETMQQAKQELADLQAYFSQGVPDYASMIQRRQLFEQQLAAYNQAVINYNQYVTDYHKNHAEYLELQNVPNQVQLLRNLLTQVALYDHAFSNYQKQIEYYNIQLGVIQEKSLLLNQYERSRIALKEARSTVKKYLVPSLNRVASALLAQMTGGSRSSVEVTEDFEIFIDGQALNTLSGSGKAVANLAIRIALGQVLIAKKFPVFMADEIDGSMDDERAEFTAECLRRLTKHVSQLLLISHKRPDADHYIELGR
jgi:DNA repair exonuclease SbcCD ATPase subunit